MRHTARKLKKRKPLTLFTKPKLHSKSTYFYKQRWFQYSIPLASTLGLLLVIGATINPVVSKTGVYAKSSGTVVLSDASLKLAVGSTSLAKPDAKAGEVNYITTSVNVKAANVDGYKVYVQAAPGSSATLKNGNTEITGVGDNIAVVNFENNKWGYALDSTGASVEKLTYTSIPENSSVLNPAYTTKATNEEKDFNLAFAAKFGTDATAGHYTTNVLLSAVAGAQEVTIFDEPTGFNGIMNMQDMTPAICSGATEGTSGRLRDTRDMKVYWITKLKDGNCWMTQNLDLDLHDDVNLTSADTDITGIWTPIATQKDTPNFAGSSENPNIVQSFDPGYYVRTAPTTQVGCSGLKGCGEWVDILSGLWKASSDPEFTGSIDESTHTYNAHYMAGNYYSYAAATAGTSPASASGAATASICPSGWQLPGSVSGDKEKNFTNLLKAYSLTNALVSGDYDIRLNPLYFIYGGQVKGSLLNTSNGYYWSATAHGYYIYNAYGLSINSTMSVSQDANLARYTGLSVRCVAR